MTLNCYNLHLQLTMWSGPQTEGEKKKESALTNVFGKGVCPKEPFASSQKWMVYFRFIMLFFQGLQRGLPLGSQAVKGLGLLSSGIMGLQAILWAMNGLYNLVLSTHKATEGRRTHGHLQYHRKRGTCPTLIQTIDPIRLVSPAQAGYCSPCKSL